MSRNKGDFEQDNIIFSKKKHVFPVTFPSNPYDFQVGWRYGGMDAINHGEIYQGETQNTRDGTVPHQVADKNTGHQGRHGSMLMACFGLWKPDFFSWLEKSMFFVWQWSGLEVGVTLVTAWQELNLYRVVPTPTVMFACVCYLSYPTTCVHHMP